jgi:very-short-patch-repair endonuclease
MEGNQPVSAALPPLVPPDVDLRDADPMYRKGFEIVTNCFEQFGLTGGVSLQRLRNSLGEIVQHDRSESVIESMMLLGLVGIFGAYHCDVQFYIDEGVALRPDDQFGRVFIRQQTRVLTYRVDFLVTAASHDFHERTRVQAQRDRSRDRALQAHGFTVLRFTGGEIWRDAAGCAAEVFDVVASAEKRKETRS